MNVPALSKSAKDSEDFDLSVSFLSLDLKIISLVQLVGKKMIKDNKNRAGIKFDDDNCMFY